MGRHHKTWLGVYKTAETGALYRSKNNLGLGLTPVVDHFERMQIVKCQILRHTVCEEAKAIYEAKAKREATSGRKWRSTRANAAAEAQANLAALFPTQSGRQGLGRGHFKAALNK